MPMPQLSIQSIHTKTEYDIEVYIPDTEVPENGFPVHYILDGLTHFGFARDIVKGQSFSFEKTGVRPAVVVGIGHKAAEMGLKRMKEFTGPADHLELPERSLGKFPDDLEYGHADKFLTFIQEELKPIIEEKYPVHTNEQSIIGHSLGGYFTLWCLFHHQDYFQKYISISPSVWWNGKELLQMTKEFLEQSPTEQKEVFISVGEKEDFMVDDSKELVSLFSNHHYTVDYYIAPEENHGSVVPTVMSRVIRFISK